jgi:hypothetical protein
MSNTDFGRNALKRLICLSYLISSILLFPAITSAYDLRLAWDSNTEPDLEGYKLYGRQDDSDSDLNLIDTYPEEELSDPLNPMIEVTDLEYEVVYEFAVTAYDTNGNESDYSDSVIVQNGEFIDSGEVSSSGTLSSGETNSGGSGGGACFIAIAAFAPTQEKQFTIKPSFQCIDLILLLIIMLPLKILLVRALTVCIFDFEFKFLQL